jgi:hypothetical protein
MTVGLQSGLPGSASLAFGEMLLAWSGEGARHSAEEASRGKVPNAPAHGTPVQSPRGHGWGTTPEPG